MNLVKTSMLSLLSTSIKMLAGLVIGKAIALTSGPAGLALLGQFQNFVQIVLTVAKGGLDTGVTKYTSEYRQDDATALVSMLSTAAWICAATAAAVSMALLVGAEPLARTFLGTPQYAYIIRLFGVTISLFALNSFLLAVVNGLHQIRTYIIANIAQSLVTLLLTVGLVAWLGLDGALIALVTNQSIVLIVLLWMLRGHAVLRLASFRHGFHRADASRLIQYSLMALVSAIVSPLSAILIRTDVAAVLGKDAAGYWQAMWYIASVYLAVVTTSLSVYYLPKLSSIKDVKTMGAELKQGFQIILPIAVLAAAILYTLRAQVVQILFTDAFIPMLSLFPYMLIGDIIKIASWLLSYLMLAKAMAQAFVATEVLFSASFVILAFLCVRLYGLEGVAIAYAVNYAVYLVTVAALTRRFWLPVRA